MPESKNPTQRAIENARHLFAGTRRGDPGTPEISRDQIDGQLAFSVDRVMAEGALYDRSAASLAIRQTGGDLVEAIFLVRAFRTTMKRFGNTKPLDLDNMKIVRRISGAFDDLPGGQILGPGYDHCQRLIDFNPENAFPAPEIDTTSLDGKTTEAEEPFSRVLDMPALKGLVPESPEELIGGPVADLTRELPAFPASRDLRLQILCRGDEGFLLSCAHSLNQESGRESGWDSPDYLGELRVGDVEIRYTPPELGFEIRVGTIRVTESITLHRSGTDAFGKPGLETGPEAGLKAGLKTGYGLVFGHNERKAQCMSLLDRAFQSGARAGQASPARDQAFVLSHCDNVEASGFVQEMKLPHFADFQSDLSRLRSLKETGLDERREYLDPIL